MKRGAPLKPGKPLERRTELDRSSRLRRTALLRAVAAVKPRRRPRGEFPARVRVRLWARFQGACVVCGDQLPAAGWTGQHRRARGAGGSSDPVAASVANGLAVHEVPCHRLIEDRPAWALSLGYRIPQGADPAGWPVTTWDGRVVRLTKDGGYAPVPTSEES